MSDLSESELRRLHPLVDPRDLDDSSDLDEWRREQRRQEQADQRSRERSAERSVAEQARDEAARNAYGPGAGRGLSGHPPQPYGSGDDLLDRLHRTAAKIRGATDTPTGVRRPISVDEAAEFVAGAGGRALKNIRRSLHPGGR